MAKILTDGGFTAWAGSFSEVAFGIATSVPVTASAAGTATVDIDWGSVAPTAVVVSPSDGSNYAAQTQTYTTSGGKGRFTIRVRHIDNTSQTTTVAVAWIAFR
jgi:hypothetical protein